MFFDSLSVVWDLSKNNLQKVEAVLKLQLHKLMGSNKDLTCKLDKRFSDIAHSLDEFCVSWAYIS